MGIPGPNDPDTAYPPEAESSPNLVAARAPSVAPGDDTPLLKLTNAAGGELVTYYPGYTGNAVTAGSLTVKMPAAQTAVVTQLGADVARVNADDLATGAHTHAGIADNAAQVQAAFGDNLAMIQAGEDYANLYMSAAETQVDGASPVVTINRAGIAKVQIHGNGDIKVVDSAAGLILSSPNGTAYRLKVDNSGELSTTAVV